MRSSFSDAKRVSVTTIVVGRSTRDGLNPDDLYRAFEYDSRREMREMSFPLLNVPPWRARALGSTSLTTRCRFKKYPSIFANLRDDRLKTRLSVKSIFFFNVASTCSIMHVTMIALAS